MLANKIQQHGSQAWLVNTGWTGGGYGVGNRIDLKHTRAIVDAIHNGSLRDTETSCNPIFGLHVPTACEGVPSQLLDPVNTWQDAEAYRAAAERLAAAFKANHAKYAEERDSAAA
jgi:phosphoenolpyruvate carboxykinase (ATP)